MSSITTEVKRIDYKLWGVLLLSALMPVLYNSIRIGFLGSLPSDWGYNIASQLAWVNVMYEVVQEALLLPIFFLFGQKKDNDSDFRNRITSGAIVVFCIYSTVGLLIFAFSPALVRLMGQDAALISKTVTYIRLEVIAKLPEILFRFFLAALVIKTRRISLLKLLLVQMLLSILLDAFLVREASTSLSLQVNGIAVSNLISYVVLAVIAYRMLSSLTQENDSKKISFIWIKTWFRVGNLSGLESFVRNAAFILMVLRLVNLVKEPGTFWLANSFIWGWLLLPVLSLGQLVRHDAANRQQKAQVNPIPYLVITLGIILLWAATSPLWGTFLKHVFRIDDYQLVLNITYISIPFYIIFAFNNVIDNIFYGLGRTDLMLIQSLVVNLIYYGSLFILYQIGIYQPGIIQIAVMFGVGMALDSLLTFVLYWRRFRIKLLPITEAGAVPEL